MSIIWRTETGLYNELLHYSVERRPLEIHECEPREWDAFLAETPGGSYSQTSLWGLAKLAAGYRARRFTVNADATIVGGAQLLIRRLPILGAVGCVPLGPVLRDDNPEAAELVVEHLHRIANEEGIFYLAIQPPAHQQGFARRLPSFGFVPAVLDLAPSASVLLDLSESLDRILSRMHKGTRHGVRASERKGIKVRDGREEDLSTFAELLGETARRRGFPTPGNGYLGEVWRRFFPAGLLKMLVAEYEGQVVSAALVMGFGQTATDWRGCWSGAEGNRYPNEALQWASIQWAKAQGYRYYDFGGIPRELAKSILSGETRRDREKHSAAFYKLGFGGQVTLCPEPQAYIYNTMLRRVSPGLSKLGSKWQLPRVLNRFK